MGVAGDSVLRCYRGRKRIQEYDIANVNCTWITSGWRGIAGLSIAAGGLSSRARVLLSVPDRGGAVELDP